MFSQMFYTDGGEGHKYHCCCHVFFSDGFVKGALEPTEIDQISTCVIHIVRKGMTHKSLHNAPD